MRRGVAFILGVGCGVLAAGAAGWGLLLRDGISARTEPGAIEARVARAVRAWSIPAEARDARNPTPETPRVLAQGLAHFADHCASCHANDGSGETALGRRLYPRAPDLRKASTQELTDGELFYIIQNGVRFTGMPGWGGAAGGADESWHLVHFIRRLPELTPEERSQMEALNPRSPEEWRRLQEEDAFLRGEPELPRPGQGAHAHH